MTVLYRPIRLKASVAAPNIVVNAGTPSGARGRIAQAGSPLDLYNSPANRFVASFIGSPAMNFLPVRVVRDASSLAAELPGGGWLALAPLAGRGGAGGEADLGIRPEHLSLAGPGEGELPGTVSVSENLGNTTYVYLDTPAGQVIVEADPATRAVPGTAVSVRFDAARAHVFDREGEAWSRAA